MKKQKVDWYFDFISPFAYFQYCALSTIKQQRPGLIIKYHPVLFAGLLKHHQHKGPAEIPAKRRMTYRYCHWYAKKNALDFSFPAAHPFNPLPMLRLTIATGCDENTVSLLFKHTWVDSASNSDFFSIAALAQIPGLENTAEQVAQPEVKDQLQRNTTAAIEQGIFGVPTLAIGEQLFWGLDMTEMAMAYLDNPAVFEGDEYKRIHDLPVAMTRL